jgi:hypothetical protein
MPTEATSVISRVSLIVRNPFRTAENSFGLWKQYMYRPSYDPDAFISVEDLYRPHISTNLPDDEEMHSELEESTHYSSKSAELILDWQNTGSSAKRMKKSIASYTQSYITQNFSLMPYNLSMPHMKTRKQIEPRSCPHSYVLSNTPILTSKFHPVINTLQKVQYPRAIPSQNCRIDQGGIRQP